MRLAGLAALLLLAGCASWSGGGRPRPWPLPALEDSPIRGAWVQTLEVERDGRRLEVLAALEGDGKTLVLAGLSPMGQRLVRITWSGAGVATEVDPHLPVKIDGEAILRDVVFTHWPEGALQAALAGTPWRAAFQGRRRSLSWKGKPWLEVSPAAGDSAAVVVDHVAEGYSLRVTTVERNPE